ncbi:MAG: NHL repeat-containing protein [Mycobacteriales bacterium]
MPSAPESHRQPSRSVYYRRRLVLAAVVTVAVIVGVVAYGAGSSVRAGSKTATGTVKTKPASPSASAHPSASPTSSALSWLPPVAPGAPTYLAPGSNPSALPGPILIADRKNNRLIIVDPQGHIRWVWPQPGDLAPGQSFLVPDDAFFSPNGHYIVATQELDFAITVIDVATGKIVWRYGHPGIPGSGPNYLWNPDDAMLLRTGNVVAADIKNCRIIQIPFGAHAISWHEGIVGSCIHNPPVQYGSPNGVFPMPNGDFLVTEINGDWVDEINAAGQVLWSTHPPGVLYPSDSNRIGPDRYLTADYSYPGQVAIFNRAGQTIWRYRPTTGAPAELNHPSLAMALPNGDILLNDDHNDRVIVINPRTNQIVWQYGHYGVAGTAPGYLNNPDGLDPLPPYSYADRYQPPAPTG